MTDKNTYQLVDKDLWSLINILRQETINPEDYYIILFLLTIYKDELININMLWKTEYFNKVLSQNVTEQYLPIFKIYEPVLGQISNEGIIEIFSIISNIFKSIMNDSFAEVFDHVLFKITYYKERYSEGYIQPRELTELIYSLIDIPSDAKIFNPFAGLASFGVHLPQSVSYFAQEINKKTWAIGSLRLIAHDKYNSSNYVCDDSIAHWPSENKQYDLIISNPPFNMRLKDQYYFLHYEAKTVEQFILQKGVFSLSPEGKLIVILPQQILYKKGVEKRLRKYLIDADLIEVLITLPSGILKYTSASFFIGIISKKKTLKGKVKLVDGKNYIITKGSKNKILNYKKLSAAINNSDGDSDSIKIVTNELIKNNDYNLHVPHYLIKKVDGIKLAEIIEPISGKYSSVVKGKYIRVRDLKGDKIDFKLNAKNLEEEHLYKTSYSISESCLLLATRWKSLKPTYFISDNNQVFLSSDVQAFKVDKAKVDIAYLINELHSDYVEEQLNAIRLGNTVPFIRVKDLQEIRIKLPSLKEQILQAKISKEIFLNYENTFNKYKLMNNKIYQENINLQFNELASLKHTLGRPRQNILDWTDNLISFLSSKQNEVVELNKEFKDFYNSSIFDALDEIKSDINFITEVLEKGERGLQMSGKKPVSLFDINKLINKLSINGYNFNIKKILLDNEDLRKRGIECNLILLKTLIENILTNAKKHAFTEIQPKNELIIELIEIDEQLILSIKNNGERFPKNYDKEKFIVKFSTAKNSPGGGIGGYDIHRIASYFGNPDWELLLDEDPLYPVEFRFTFKIIPMEQ